ncbi:hypothetical protein HHX48_07055 [Salinimonas sp. HHU 13199]|uniref:Uncharacterized protein n=1 Tax=Salinimonas profundi TaxID=2729140 RepID=A0ABR8LN10_9ALTE|nr:hypothetical protein [Salinimonas profundi]MBD3585485.1 hypothetical protein [Salinimonas profundi]
MSKTAAFDITVILSALTCLFVAVLDRVKAGVAISSNPWFISAMVIIFLGYLIRKKQIEW